MSEQSNGNPSQDTRQIPSELPALRDLAGVDCSGLTRTIEMLAAGSLKGESSVALLRHELVNVQRQAESARDLLQSSSVALRQLRESAHREQVQKQDEQRQLQDQNDRFVANLIHEHEVEMVTLKRERDAAFDRIRELSRGITRVGSASSANLQRVSIGNTVRAAKDSQETVELNARIEDLLYERERTLRLLRQLAEQRDHAESRLQATLASIGSHDATGTRLGSERGSGRVPTLPDKAIHATAELGVLENPDEWDIDRSANAASPSSNVPTPSKSGIGAKANPADASPPVTPLLPAAHAGIERPGTYSLHTDELSAEEVCVSRVPRSAPKNT